MMSIRVEFDPGDLWIGMYWHVIEIGYRDQWDIYICLVPMLPIHIHWSKRMPDE